MTSSSQADKASLRDQFRELVPGLPRDAAFFEQDRIPRTTVALADLIGGEWDVRGPDGKRYPVLVEIAAEPNELTPAREPDDAHFVWDREVVRGILCAQSTGLPLMLYGPQGSGKTAALRMWAALTNAAYLAVPCASDDEAYDLMGQTVVADGRTRFVASPLVAGYVFGGVTVLEEFDNLRPAVGVALNPFFQGLPAAAKGMPMMRLPQRHPRCLLAATANTGGIGEARGQFRARQSLDLTTRERFGIWVRTRYPERDAEHAVLESVREAFIEQAERAGIRGARERALAALSDVGIEVLLKMAEATRAAAQSPDPTAGGEMLMHPMSTRILTRVAKLALVVGDLWRAFRAGYLDMLGPADRTAVEMLWRSVVGTNPASDDATPDAGAVEEEAAA